MTDTNGNKIYNIGEAAKMFKVATSLVRYWESEFDILNPDKDEKGNRFYTEQDIEDLRLIFHLVKERGFTLQGAKQELESRENHIREELNIKNELLKVRSFLTDLKNQFNAHERK